MLQARLTNTEPFRASDRRAGNGAMQQSSEPRITLVENQRMDILREQLERRAQLDPAGFRQALRTAFGGKADLQQIDQLLDLALAGKLPMPASVRLVDSGSLGQGVRGAYESADGGAVYLDRSLFEGDPQLLQSVFNEEMGHHFDALLGGADATGDEGAVFARTLDEGALSPDSLRALQAENDHGQILVDGRQAQVEFDAGAAVHAITRTRDTDGNHPEFEQFMNFVRAQRVERTVGQGFVFEVVAASWDDLPESVRNYEPGTGWGALVDDSGAHFRTQRLPGGYHLAQETETGKVYLHHDAHDPIEDPIQTVLHGANEVLPLGFGRRDTSYKNDRPNWGNGGVLGNDTTSSPESVEQGLVAELLTDALAKQPDADIALGPVLGGISEFLSLIDSEQLATVKLRLLQGEKAIDLVQDIARLVDDTVGTEITGFLTENGTYIEFTEGNSIVDIGINTVRVPRSVEPEFDEETGKVTYLNEQGERVTLKSDERIVASLHGPGKVRQSISSFMELAKLGVFGENIKIFGKEYSATDLAETWSLTNRGIDTFNSFRDLNRQMGMLANGVGHDPLAVFTPEQQGIKDDIAGKLQDQAWTALGIGFDAWSAFTGSDRERMIAQYGSKAVDLFQSIDNLKDAYAAIDNATTAADLATAQNALPGKIVSVVGAVVAIVGLLAEDGSDLKEVANYASAILTIWGAWANATSASAGTGALVFAIAATVATIVSLFYEGKTNNAVLATMDVNGDGTDETVKYDPGNDRFEYMVNLEDPGISVNQFSVDLRQTDPDAGLFRNTGYFARFNVDPAPLIEGIPDSGFRNGPFSIELPVSKEMHDRIVAINGAAHGDSGPGQIPEEMKQIMREINSDHVARGGDEPFRVMFKNEEPAGQNFLLDVNGDGNLDRVQHYMDLTALDGPNFVGSDSFALLNEERNAELGIEPDEDAEYEDTYVYEPRIHYGRRMSPFIVNLRDANGIEYERIEVDTLEEITTAFAISPITLSYVASHPDLIEAIGTDVRAAGKDFHAHGEERGITFDPAAYLLSNPDVLKARGSDLAQASRHYIEYGYSEGRTTGGVSTSTLLGHQNLRDDPSGVMRGLAVKLPELAYLLKEADVVDVTPEEAARFIEIILDAAPNSAAVVAEVLAAADPAAVEPPAVIEPPEIGLADPVPAARQEDGQAARAANPGDGLNGRRIAGNRSSRDFVIP